LVNLESVNVFYIGNGVS